MLKYPELYKTSQNALDFNTKVGTSALVGLALLLQLLGALDLLKPRKQLQGPDHGRSDLLRVLIWTEKLFCFVLFCYKFKLQPQFTGVCQAAVNWVQQAEEVPLWPSDFLSLQCSGAMVTPHRGQYCRTDKDCPYTYKVVRGNISFFSNFLFCGITLSLLEYQVVCIGH